MQNFLSANRDTIKNIIKIILFILLCFSTLALLMCIAAFIIYHINFSYEILYPLTTVILCISAFIDGLITSKLLKQNGLIIGVICGIILSLIVIISSVYMGGFNITQNLFTKVVSTIIAGALGGVIGVNIN